MNPMKMQIQKKKNIEPKPEAKEDFVKSAEKTEGQKIISTNEKYKDLINGLNENPWDVNSEKNKCQARRP